MNYLCIQSEFPRLVNFRIGWTLIITEQISTACPNTVAYYSIQGWNFYCGNTIIEFLIHFVNIEPFQTNWTRGFTQRDLASFQPIRVFIFRTTKKPNYYIFFSLYLITVILLEILSSWDYYYTRKHRHINLWIENNILSSASLLRELVLISHFT